MRKLVIALLMPMLIIGLTGCEDEGGFVNKEPTISVNIITTDSNDNPTNTVASNPSNLLPNDNSTTTMHVYVLVTHVDGDNLDPGTVVNMSFTPSGYGSLSKLNTGDDDSYDDFYNCDISDPALWTCFYVIEQFAEVGNGFARFFFTSRDVSCPAADQPCVTLYASVMDPGTGREVTASKPIVVW